MSAIKNDTEASKNVSKYGSQPVNKTVSQLPKSASTIVTQKCAVSMWVSGIK